MKDGEIIKITSVSNRFRQYLAMLLMVCFACLITDFLYAETTTQTYQQTLSEAVGITPLEQDVIRYDASITILGNIFGTVGDVLVGGKYTVFGQLFYLFNVGCMVLATISLSYSSMVIVVESAGEGAALGKKMQQTYFYLIFRQLSSVVLMTPQFNGYSGIQVLLMWLVVQGVYLADIVWLKTAEYVMLTQGIASNVIDVANAQPGLSGESANADNTLSPTQPQLEASKKTVMYIYQATMCALLYPMTQGQAVKAVSFSDLTIKTNYDSSEKLTGYSIVFPNDCGAITTIYRNSPAGLTQDQQQALLNGVQSSLQLTVQMVMDFVTAALPSFQSTDCLATLSHNMNLASVPEACKISCDTAPQGMGCPISVMLLQAITQLATSVQIQSSMIEQLNQLDPEDAKVSLESLYGIGWIGIATQYYRGVHNIVGGSTAPVSQGYSISNYTILNKVTYSGLVTAFAENIHNMIKIIMRAPPLPTSTDSTVNCDDINDASESFAIWYCQAQAVTTQAQNIVKSLWSDIDVDSMGFHDLSTWDKMYDDYYSRLDSQTSDVAQWTNISPEFWPLMNTYHVSVSNAWIRTFLDPANLKALITDPLYTFSQLAKFLTAASISYMMKATGEVVKDLLLFAEEVVVVTNVIAIPAIMFDAIFASLQTYGYIETNVCWSAQSGMTYPMLPFCLIIWFFFIPIIISWYIGIIVSTVTTVIRLVVKVIFDTVLSVVMMLVQVGIAYKMRYVALVFTIASPVLTIASYFAVYIPMLPVLMYTIAIVGWVISVIEAMIGVPMVLLGMTSMKGHDLFGSAQQTMILLLSVFLRPVTLVIGFVFGVIILSVFGFVLAMFLIPYLESYLNIMQNMNLDSLSQAVILAMVMLMYLSIYATVIQLAFGSMFKIPYSIMRWIGLTGASSGEEEIMDQIQSETRSQLGSMSGIFSGMQGGMQKVGGNVGSGKASLAELGAHKMEKSEMNNR